MITFQETVQAMIDLLKRAENAEAQVAQLQARIKELEDKLNGQHST